MPIYLASTALIGAGVYFNAGIGSALIIVGFLNILAVVGVAFWNWWVIEE